MAVSPAFARDKTAYCLTWVRNPQMVTGPTSTVASRSAGTKDVGLHVTTDAGRTWRRIETDLPWDADTELGGLALSPLWARDRLLAVHLSNYGVYTSTDGGEHFTVAGAGARTAFGRPPYGGPLTSFAATTPDQPVAAFAFFDGSVALIEEDPANEPVHVGWNGNSAIVPAAGGHVPVTGAPGFSNEGFQLSATFGSGGHGYVLGQHMQEHAAGVLPATWRTAIWRCDVKLTCSERVTVFPDNWSAPQLLLLDGSGTQLGVVLYEPQGDGRTFRIHARRSSDAGATWRSWPALQRALAPFAGDPLPTVRLAVDPAGYRRIVLRISNAGASDADGIITSPGAAPMGEQVWVSSDGGARFVRTAYGPSYGQRGTGNLPWHGVDADSVLELHAAGGRIFTNAATVHRGKVTYRGIFCSRDGRRWARTC